MWGLFEEEQLEAPHCIHQVVHNSSWYKPGPVSALKSAGCLRIPLCKHQAIHSRRAHLHFQRNFCLGLLVLDFVSKEENILQVVSEKRKPQEMNDLNYSENESQQFLVLLHFLVPWGGR